MTTPIPNKDQALTELAKEYWDTVTRYNASVCSGWNYAGTPVPNTMEELTKIEHNSKLAYGEVVDKAIRMGYTLADIVEAIFENIDGTD
jgi:hypothetical protein